MTEPLFQIRPAQRADTQRILDLVLDLDPGDHVPGILGELLQEGLVLAERAGQLVGIFHVTRVAPGEANFSTMRIARSLQGQGYGRAFLRTQIDLAHRGGCRTLYVLIAEHNLVAQRTAQGSGFARLGAWRVWTQMADAPLGDTDLADVVTADLRQVPALLRFFAARPTTGVEGVITRENSPWQVRSLQGRDFADMVAAGCVGLFPGAGGLPEGLIALAPAPEPGAPLLIRYLKGTRAATAALLAWARARSLGSDRLALSLPGPQADAAMAVSKPATPGFSGHVFVHRAEEAGSP